MRVAIRRLRRTFYATPHRNRRLRRGRFDIDTTTITARPAVHLAQSLHGIHDGWTRFSCPAPAHAAGGASMARLTTHSRKLGVSLVFAFGFATSAQTQEIRSDTLFTTEKYLNFEQVGDPQISPDGSQIIYARRYVDKMNDRWETALWIMNVDGTKNRFLVKGGRPLAGRPTARRSFTRPTESRVGRRSSCAGWMRKVRRRRSRACQIRSATCVGRPTESRSALACSFP